MNYTIEALQPAHWPEVARIYQAGIDTRMASFQKEVPSWEVWDEGHKGYGRLVACHEGKVVGWVALSRLSNKSVDVGVVEISIYIDEAYKGFGIGTALMKEAVRISEENGIWSIYSAIIRENEGSIALHRKCGFREVGIREKIAKMPNGVWHDVVLMEKRSKVVGI